MQQHKRHQWRSVSFHKQICHIHKAVMAGFVLYLLGLICAFCSCSPCPTSLGKPESTQPLVRQSRAFRRSVSSLRTRLSGTAKEEKRWHLFCVLSLQWREMLTSPSGTKPNSSSHLCLIGIGYLHIYCHGTPKLTRSCRSKAKDLVKLGAHIILQCTFSSQPHWTGVTIVMCVTQSKCKNNDPSCGKETGKEFLSILHWTQQVIMVLPQQATRATAPIYPKAWRFYNWKYFSKLISTTLTTALTNP